MSWKRLGGTEKKMMGWVIKTFEVSIKRFKQA
jgi:hypothetical protein